jgi:hypothetical protein
MAALAAATLAASAIGAGTMSADAATTTSTSTTTTSSAAQPSIQRVTGHGPSISPNHPWTIQYWDAHGHLTRVWHGTKAQADVLSARWRSAHATPRPAGVDPAIVHASSCSEPTTYWVFWHWKMECFAYNGSMSIYITGIYQVDSGNNYGYFRFSGSGTNHYLNSYSSAFYTNETVVFINILRRCKDC